MKEDLTKIKTSLWFNENREFDGQKGMKIRLKNAKRCVNIMFIFSIWHASFVYLSEINCDRYSDDDNFISKELLIRPPLPFLCADVSSQTIDIFLRLHAFSFENDKKFKMPILNVKWESICARRKNRNINGENDKTDCVFKPHTHTLTHHKLCFDHFVALIILHYFFFCSFAAVLYL